MGYTRVLQMTQAEGRKRDSETLRAGAGRRRNSRLAWLLVLAAVVAAPLWYIHIINRYLPSTKSDLLARWVGTRAALRGEDPYSPQVLREIQTAYYGAPLAPGDGANPQAFLYPAPVVLLLAPLAKLPWDGARLAFLLLAAPLLGWSLWLCLKSLSLPGRGWQSAAILICCFFSWPVMWGLRVQQMTLLPVASLVFIAWFLLTRGDAVLPGLLLAVATIKPQLVLPLLLWLFLWAGLRRRWTLAAAYAGGVAALSLATELVVPGWFGHWRASLSHYRDATHTALSLEHVLGHWAGLTLTALLAAASAAALWRLRRNAPELREFGLAVSLALATTVCLLPTNAPLIYNDVLLVPGCLVLIFSRPRGAAAAIARALALAQVGWDFLVLWAAAGSDAVGHMPAVLALLPFQDFLLPELVTLALILVSLKPSEVLAGRAIAEPRLAAP